MTNNMKTLFSGSLILFVVSLILVWSCTKDDDKVCDVNNPSEELQWLKEELEAYEDDVYSYYMQGEYKGSPVFYYQNCNPAINYDAIVRSCDGEGLGSYVFLESFISNSKLIWKSEGNVCIIP